MVNGMLCAIRNAFVAAALFAVAGHAQRPLARVLQPPRTIMLRGDGLLAARAHAGDKEFRPAVEALARDAERAMADPLLAVTEKRSLMPPSGNAHDYFSLSPYWWPDPSKHDGLPYIRRDGVTNPESKKDLDQPRIANMSENVSTLALAWWYTGDDRFAARAALQLRRWFLDPATRMTPHLRYAQLIRGEEKARRSGVIDGRTLLDVVDAVVLLEQSGAWSPSDDRALRQWYGAFATWLGTDPVARDEGNAKNNHGSWFAAQAAAYALFAGDTTSARATISGVRDRIDWQIQPDGKQPEELVRTKSYHYSNFNVEALSRLAEMGRLVGVDLWHYHAPGGGSLTSAIDRLAPFVDRQREWPDPEIANEDATSLLTTFRRVRVALADARYDAVIARVLSGPAASDRAILLFPLAGSR